MGVLLSLLSQFFPPSPKFAISDIPDLTGKVFIVTGGAAGIGKETVKALLTKNANVYIATRNSSKAATVIAELQQLTGNSAKFLPLDLADLGSIKTAANEFMSKESELHVLFNNAGVMNSPIEDVTKDGYDLQFGTNVLGHFYFTKLLLPRILSTAQTSPPGTVRVVNISSSAAYFGDLNFSTFKDGPARKKASPQTLYAQSKYGNIVLNAELARRYGDQGIVFTTPNPGNINTEMQQSMSPMAMYIFQYLVYDVPHGALTQLWAGTSEEGKDLNGKYLIPWARVGSPPAGALDGHLGADLWEWCEEQVKDI